MLETDGSLEQFDIVDSLETPFLVAKKPNKAREEIGPLAHNLIENNILKIASTINSTIENEVSKVPVWNIKRRMEERKKLYEKLAEKERKADGIDKQLKLASESMGYYETLKPKGFIHDFAYTEDGLYAINRIVAAQKSFIKANTPQPNKVVLPK